MPLVDTDIAVYAAANKPEDDTGLNGGAIDLKERISFSGPLAGNAALELISDSASDNTQDATVWARKADGSEVNEIVALNGTTAVQLSTIGTVERVLRVLLDGDAVGNVTLRVTGAGATVGVIPPTERGFRRMFISAFSDPSSPKEYYEKIFFRNNDDTFAALNAAIVETADPQADYTFTLAASKDEAATSTNRLTAPAVGDTDPDTFDGASKNVPGTNLGVGEAIGVWVNQTLVAGASPYKDSFTLQMTGQTA